MAKAATKRTKPVKENEDRVKVNPFTSKDLAKVLSHSMYYDTVEFVGKSRHGLAIDEIPRFSDAATSNTDIIRYLKSSGVLVLKDGFYELSDIGDIIYDNLPARSDLSDLALTNSVSAQLCLRYISFAAAGLFFESRFDVLFPDLEWKNFLDRIPGSLSRNQVMFRKDLRIGIPSELEQQADRISKAVTKIEDALEEIVDVKKYGERLSLTKEQAKKLYRIPVPEDISLYRALFFPTELTKEGNMYYILDEGTAGPRVRVENRHAIKIDCKERELRSRIATKIAELQKAFRHKNHLQYFYVLDDPINLGDGRKSYSIEVFSKQPMSY